MATTRLYKTYDVTGDLAPYRIAAHGAPYRIRQATAPTDALLGTTDEIGKQSNGRADIAMSDQPEVMLGATVTAGQALTSDAQGAAVPATAAGQRIIGYALEGGQAGTIITYQFAPGCYTPSA